MNLSVARSFRAALYLLLAIMLTLTTLVSGTSPASAAPDLPAAPADPIVEIEDRIPEAVPVTPIPVEVPTTVIEAGAQTTDSVVETEPTATPQPTDEATPPDAPDTAEPSQAATDPTAEDATSSEPVATETQAPESSASESSDTAAQTPASEPATEGSATAEPSVTEPSVTEPTEEPSADDPNADAPVELVEAADELPEATYAMASAVTTAEVNIVGISWDNPGIEQDAAVYLRTSNPSGWDAWEQYETEQNPDASDRIGSDPIVIMGAGLEVQVAVSYGDHSPENTTMVVVDPQQVPADELATEDANGDEVVRASANQGTSANSDGIVRANARIAGPVTDEATTAGITRTNAPAGSVNPVIYSRADWGADERYMTWTPTRGTVGGVVVHHTAGGNGYSSAQVPGIIRGIYYYHAVTLGWGDIGYNIVVDTYGRLWEGRAGGLTNPIVGGHAINWNASTFGISVLGDFTKIALPQASMNALAQGIAWKFRVHGVNPNGTVRVGNTTRPTIMGHLDVASTACPGNYIYSRMGELRTNVTNLMGAATAPTAKVALAPLATNATAASGLLGYDPNYLISDAVMYNSGTMNAAQVQSFLNEKGASCVKGSDGSACIKDARFNTPNRPATQFCPNASVGRNGQTAAQVIMNSAVGCGVNPQVLLTILQKEQGLITTTDPTKRKYERATGFACPDFQACDSSYSGFVHQVYSAASRLQQYRMQPNNFNYRVGGTYNMLYNPNSSCGTAQVTLKSAATAALYNYTPYVANQAALDAVAGAGDSCSAYGNRNFYRNFNLWFGRPNADAPPIDSAAASFPVHTQTQIGRGWTQLIAPGDWTGDGVPDAMTIDANARLILYPGAAGGGFQPSRQIGKGWGQMDTVLAGVDWDGDGRNDLIGRSKAGRLYLYSGNGYGGFSDSRLIGRGWGGATKLAVMDGANQGLPVIRAIDSAGRLISYPADGRGGFRASITHGTGWLNMQHIFGVGDSNGDGVGDFVAIRSDGAMLRYPGQATGQIGRAQQIGVGWQGWRTFTSADQSAVNGPVWAVNSRGVLYRFGSVVG